MTVWPVRCASLIRLGAVFSLRYDGRGKILRDYHHHQGNAAAAATAEGKKRKRDGAWPFLFHFLDVTTRAAARWAWPGWQTSACYAMTQAPTSENWRGGLVDGMRDATGQMYMRNRYYDPGTGQFTQPDPIGIAGGLNVYGFAAGDPVSYSNPYGLRVMLENAEAYHVWNDLKAEVTRSLNSQDPAVRDAAEFLRRTMNDVISDTVNSWSIKVGNLGLIDAYFTWTAGGAQTGMVGSSRMSARTTMFSGRPQGLDAVINLAHELGHAHAIMNNLAPALRGLPTENAARLLRGCTKRRELEYSRPPSCN